MPVVRVEQLQAGFTLRKAVRDLSGRLLLGEGERILEKHLHIFKAWGVTEVEVSPAEGAHPLDAPEGPSPPSRDPLLWERARQQVNRALGRNDLRNPLIQELLRLAQEHYYQRLVEDE